VRPVDRTTDPRPEIGPVTRTSTYVEHLDLHSGDVGQYVLMPGDPGRCEALASHLEDARMVGRNREFTSFTGTLLGRPVSVTSTGIGGPSTATAAEELFRLGAHTLIRVGTSGSMQPWIVPGDLAVLSGAIRDEGTSSHYLPPEFPAVANTDVVVALRDGARDAGAVAHVGIGQSKDAWYGQREPEHMPMPTRLAERWKAWMAGGALCSEMEAATLFVVAATRGIRAGGVMLVYGHPDQSPMTEEEGRRCSIELLNRAAIRGLARLIERDARGETDPFGPARATA
jgi:uridine phosphorylase